MIIFFLLSKKSMKNKTDCILYVSAVNNLLSHNQHCINLTKHSNTTIWEDAGRRGYTLGAKSEFMYL